MWNNLSYMAFHDTRAWICKPVSLGMSALCMTLLSREERFATVNWGQKCPESLWERENHRRGSDRPPDYVLTGSKRVKTLCWPAAEWCEAPGLVSNSERGDKAPWKEETEETSNCYPHVSDCCFRLPRGELEGVFEDGGLISAHMLPWRHQSLNWG